jgi:hypothetical protein
VNDTRIRPDSELAGVDVPAAISAGLRLDGAARRTMFTSAAIAAALQAERREVGPYPLNFLADHVRAAGRAGALALPEPLVGAVDLAQSWLRAASEAAGGVGNDDLFAQWLETVAALIMLRRKAGRAGAT